MPDESTSQILTATRRWLKPVVHVLLRCGITWHQFCDLAKVAYVDVATTKFGKRGRPTNVSRTAILTGLTRRDVRIQRERMESSAPLTVAYESKASRILSAWHLDPAFLDSDGSPARLPIEGTGATFEALVHQCGIGDLRALTVMRELLHAGAIKKLKDGRLEVLQRNFIPQATDEQLIRLWGTVLGDVANTYVHNMTRSRKTPPRFERAAKNDQIPIIREAAFRQFLESEGQAFLERVDAWLAENEAKETDSAAGIPTTRMGVGVYHIED